MSALTEQQRTAVEAEGNVLVVAGAGTGKTHTLVERCLARICAANDPVSIENILMVTFTEAAAAEMRKRLRDELECRAGEQPENEWLAGQLALLDTAHISTLHGFCLQLVREHFHQLDLDPQLNVLSEEQALLLEHETLEKVIQRHYAAATPAAEAVQQLILDQGRGRDDIVRKMVLRLHHYTQTLRDPQGWMRKQLEQLDQASPTQWLDWLILGAREWRDEWMPVLRLEPPENVNAHKCVEALTRFGDRPTREEVAQSLAAIVELGRDEHWPRTKGKFRDGIADLFDEAAFLHALASQEREVDPLQQDWDWARPPMKALLGLVQEFGEKFADAKRELASLDFHDLEQFALRLLLDEQTAQPGKIALRWRERFRLIFVDEYQDINAAQDAILSALGREGDAANRFLVGDIKQSIYRFRLADPTIFRSYKEAWEHGGQGKALLLTENFRSREKILEVVNSLFATLMHREVGGVEYDDAQHLQFGAPEQRGNLSAQNDDIPRVELHLTIAERNNSESSADEAAETTGVEGEAGMVGLRLQELHHQKFQVWDKHTQNFRPVEWRDMTILLRAPRNKAEAYAKVFHQLGLPLVVARGGFFETIEVMDVLSLLRTLDNPLQDVPLLAMLRSPFVGLSLDELATIRLSHRKGAFWTALVRWHEKSNSDPLFAKVDLFLKRFHEWRQLARRAALSQCLETALEETHYEAWLQAQPRGEQRHGNIQRFLALTRQFDQFQRQGLFRFLRFVAAQLDVDADMEPASPSDRNAIQLMSIHQSKGLDFPVVVLADVGKRFNFDDLNQRVILDEYYGLCSRVKPPATARMYPSLPYWLARRRQRRESLGEELRLLYVATTRARDLLVLSGTCSRKAIERWKPSGSDELPPHKILSANSFLDWLGLWFPDNGEGLLSLTVHEGDGEQRAGDTAVPVKEGPLRIKDLKALKRKLEWTYAFDPAIHEPAKTSVSALRRRLRDDTDAEAWPLFDAVTSDTSRQGLSAIEIGTVHHLFLQMAALDQMNSPQQLEKESQRLRNAGVLSETDVAALDLKALAQFWTSPVGQKILAQNAKLIHRELPFTARMSGLDLEKVGLPVAPGLDHAEFVVTQGVLDLAVILPKEMWILDFKTDNVSEHDVEARAAQYKSQLQLYALAVSRIYRRPVTECWLHFLSCGKTVSL